MPPRRPLVGAIDWNLREYHGYTLPGTTYNAYLVRGGEKTALIDGAYHGFEGEVLGRIGSVCDPETIDYIVVNHIEMDHSGTLPALVKKLPDTPIYCTERARAGLARHYDITGWKIRVVKSGDTLDLGGKTLTFLEAPMLHWPDSMFTYLAEDAILFPNDAFGQHVASAARFDDELGHGAAMAHAQKFFANLIIPLAPKVLKKLDEVGGLGIDIRMIAPSHGIIWRSHAGDILKAYVDWSRGGVAKDKVTIVYDTMHGSTTMMAKAIAEGGSWPKAPMSGSACCGTGATKERTGATSSRRSSTRRRFSSGRRHSRTRSSHGGRVPQLPPRVTAGPPYRKEDRVRVRVPRWHGRRGCSGGGGPEGGRDRGDRRRVPRELPAGRDEIARAYELGRTVAREIRAR
ncbi:FprA family A-type flavoprotein [Methanoculleus chikugoensis]|uniref:FprA family A-type flavoprotein n=1 Tax=Methanoculleus chikugoensis TaxID=118126 RepID=UPI000A498469|nr:FprA family A-type flavoprotein [Methanoculleus chikugoensis]